MAVTMEILRQGLKSSNFARVSKGLEGLEFALLILNLFNDFNIVLFAESTLVLCLLPLSCFQFCVVKL